MSNPISLAFKKAKQENRAALLTYTVAGDSSKKQSLDILKSISKDDSFQFSSNDKERKLHLIPVTFTASDTPGKIVETIQITTGASDGTSPDEKKALKVVAHVEVLSD